MLSGHARGIEKQHFHSFAIVFLARYLIRHLHRCRNTCLSSNIGFVTSGNCNQLKFGKCLFRYIVLKVFSLHTNNCLVISKNNLSESSVERIRIFDNLHERCKCGLRRNFSVHSQFCTIHSSFLLCEKQISLLNYMSSKNKE